MAAEQGMLEFQHQPTRSWKSHDVPVRMIKKAWVALSLMIHRGLSAVQDSLDDSIEEHDEPTFRLLLSLEQTRCKKSGRGFHILLCTVCTQDGTPITMDEVVTALVFTQVRGVLRKTDYVGWYTQNRTVGILLTCLDPRTGVASSRHAMDRLRLTLTDQLALHDPSLVIQLYDELQLPPFGQHQTTESTTPTYTRQD